MLNATTLVENTAMDASTGVAALVLAVGLTGCGGDASSTPATNEAETSRAATSVPRTTCIFR